MTRRVVGSARPAPSTHLRRLAFDPRNLGGVDWRTTVLLTAALASVFVFSAYDRGQFYRANEHDALSGQHMAIAANLSPEHGFLQFLRRHFDANGEPTYEPYHRFPLLGYVLIKMVGLPFGDDLSARLYAARMLMLAFFAGAMVLAYLSLRRLTGRRATALAATLLAFSSHPILYHSDIVAPEAVMGLFSVMLAFHGVAVYLHGGAAGAGSRVAAPDGGMRGNRNRIGQLCAKTTVCILLDWHVYGLLLPLFLLALPSAIYQRDWRGCWQYALLGATAVVAGLAMLAFNLLREYHGFGGSTPFLDLPSLQSMLRRTGVAPVDPIGWGAVLQGQLRGIGQATLPWALAAPLEGCLHGHWHWLGGACMMAAALAICLPGTRHRIAWGALALSGLGWALPMRHQVHTHTFEVLFHVGAPLTACALVLTRLQAFAATWTPRAGRPLGATGVAAGFVLFVASVWLMGRVGDDARTRERERAFLADVQAIRRHTQGKVVYVPWSVLDRNMCCRPIHLTGSVMATEPTDRADFVLATDIPRSTGRSAMPPNSPASRSLTPNNRLVFLYEPDAYRAALTAARGVYERHAAAKAPAIESAFAVHHVDDALLYVGEGDRCPVEGRRTKFFLHVYPQDVQDLPERQRRVGFANLDFQRDRNWRRGGRCFALRFLPAFPIAEIRTGQFVKRYGFQTVWEGRLSFDGGSNAGEHGAAGGM